MIATVTRLPTRRYTTVAIALHWLIAVAILALIASGEWMSDAIRDPASKAFAFRVFQWHKSLGLIVLVLSFARLAWRLSHAPPALPASMGQFPRLAAGATHWLFYGLMIAMPLVGWAMVSASPLGLKTMIFGLFEWPHLPILPTLADKAAAESTLKSVHAIGGKIFLALIALHVAAALKHQFVDRDDVLSRMWPTLRRPTAAISGLNGQSRLNGSGHAAHAGPPRRPGAKPMRWLVPLAILLAAAALLTMLGRGGDPAQRPKPVASSGQSAPTPAAGVARWQVDTAASRIAFSGTHTGTAFSGTFASWTADIAFDPANLPASRATVTVDLASARTGDATYDSTLPTADWLDTATSPSARFSTTAITSTGGTSYLANGMLTIRGASIPVALEFDLTIDGETARMTGRTRLRRLDFGIGRGADAAGDWVSLEIPLTVSVVARRLSP